MNNSKEIPVGTVQIRYTISIIKKNPSIYGGIIWSCPKCNYYTTSSIPNDICNDCKHQLRVDGPGEGVTKFEVIKTDYGWE